MFRGKSHQYRIHSTLRVYNSIKLFSIIACLSAVALVLLGAAPTVAAGLDIRIGAGGSDPAPSGGPPAHAPAHGVRAKKYLYYPSANVYFEPVQGMYFYLSGGEWTAGVSLPDGLKVQLGDFVSLELGTDRPYELNAEHLVKYKPGKAKTKAQKVNGKAKGKKK